MIWLIRGVLQHGKNFVKKRTEIHFSIFIENRNWNLKFVFRFHNENEKRKKFKILFHFKMKIECPLRPTDFWFIDKNKIQIILFLKKNTNISWYKFNLATQSMKNVWRMFGGMFYDIPQNVWRNSPESLATFPRMFGDIPRNVLRHSAECFATFPGMFCDIPRNVLRHFPECLGTFLRMLGDIPRNITFLPFPEFSAFRSPFLYSCFYT